MQIQTARKTWDNLHILSFIMKLVLQMLRTVNGKTVINCKCDATDKQSRHCGTQAGTYCGPERVINGMKFGCC